MMKTYKIRLLPTPEQERLLWQHANASRFVWNWGLARNMERFSNGDKYESKVTNGKELTQLKRHDEKFQWLNEVSYQTLSMTLIDLHNAYKRFFATQKQGEKFTKKTIARAARQKRKLTPYDMNGHPKFKMKDEQTPRFYMTTQTFYISKDTIQLEKFGKVKLQTSYTLPIISNRKVAQETVINPRVKYENGKWLLTFGIECQETQKPELNGVIGIDVGVKTLAVCSNGLIIKNVNKTKRVRKLERRLKRKQRAVQRKRNVNPDFKKTGRANRHIQADKQVKQLYTKLRNIRQDYTHKATRQIVNLLPKTIVMEDLNVSGMMKNQHLAKAIAQQNLYEFKRQIQYKSEWQGTEVALAERWFPSSKKCSRCGSIKRDLKLKDRVYKCDACGLEIDRDYNASKNLEQLGA